ncbi:uncharacterized protein LOC131858821 [Cryptomeria japonica]|uniref:uncharacterized protein LOC131858821 n=1 Tax=Cryptomeria japonica TaxID=3369 RepID=UPI0027DA18D5|nr:uncharacterized protein LOC131858821 [Cryptomeria japonica]
MEEMMKMFYKLEQASIESTLQNYNILLDSLSATGKCRKCMEILSWLGSSSVQPQVNMYKKVLKCLENEGNDKYIVLVQEKIEKMENTEFACVKAKDVACEILKKVFTNALPEVLSPPLMGYDSLLADIMENSLTEVVAPTGSGKTQFCLMLSVLAALPENHGGLNGNVVYIDTEHKFNS